MKQKFILVLAVAGACLMSSCTKSTSSSEYDSAWRPYASTAWTTPSGITNFSATDGGFSFDAAIASTNAVDTLGVKLTFIPSMYLISNIETGGDAQFTISATVSSNPDSMKLVTPANGVQYTFYQFGAVRGNAQTYGIDSVLTKARSFSQDQLFAYAPSIHPDSCSKRISVQLILNWKKYTGAAVLDTLKTTKISVKVQNMALTVTGIDILK